MMFEVLSPGMEYAQQTNVGSEMLRGAEQTSDDVSGARPEERGVDQQSFVLEHQCG